MFKLVRTLILGALAVNAIAHYLHAYDDRNRTAEGLFGGALGGALIGGLAGGGRGAGIGAAVGAGVGIMAGSAADRRAADYYEQDSYYNEPSSRVYEYINENGRAVFYGRNRLYYTYDAYGNPQFFYNTRRGRVYVDSATLGY